VPSRRFATTMRSALTIAAVALCAGVAVILLVDGGEDAPAPVTEPAAAPPPPQAQAQPQPTQPAVRERRPTRRRSEERPRPRREERVPSCKELVAQNPTLAGAPPEVRNEVARGGACTGPVP
jgi:hypothetical protein